MAADAGPATARGQRLQDGQRQQGGPMDLEGRTEHAPDETVETRVERLLNAAVWDRPDRVRAKLTASPEKLSRLEEILL